MPGYRTLKSFRHWLQANRSKFLFPPKVILRTRHSYVLKFAGVSPHILWFVDKEGWNELWVYYHGQQLIGWWTSASGQNLGVNSWLYFSEDKDRGFAMVLLKPQSPDECHRPWEQEINCLERFFLAAVPIRVTDEKL